MPDIQFANSDNWNYKNIFTRCVPHLVSDKKNRQIVKD